MPPNNWRNSMALLQLPQNQEQPAHARPAAQGAPPQGVLHPRLRPVPGPPVPRAVPQRRRETGRDLGLRPAGRGIPAGWHLWLARLWPDRRQPRDRRFRGVALVRHRARQHVEQHPRDLLAPAPHQLDLHRKRHAAPSGGVAQRPAGRSALPDRCADPATAGRAAGGASRGLGFVHTLRCCDPLGHRPRRPSRLGHIAALLDAVLCDRCAGSALVQIARPARLRLLPDA